MKHKMGLIAGAFYLIASFGFAQVDLATSTVTNDATMARLRVSNCVFGGPNIDIYLNGEVAVNNGIPQSNVPTLIPWGYQYLTPGTYSVAVVPTGMGLGEALMGPVDVTVEAGHRYTLVVLGQNDEPSHEALVVDETKAYQDIGASPTDAAHITVNNVKGLSGIDIDMGGAVQEHNVPYGEFQAVIWPVGSFNDFFVTVGDAPDEVLDGGPGPGFTAPAMDYFDCFGGSYPGAVFQDFDTRSSMPTSSLNAVNYLKEVTRIGRAADGDAPTFDTFLKALETAGLTETLATGGPYLLNAPTDKAFSALPQDELDALMADPEALADLVRYHVGEGYYPYGNLLDPSTSERVVATMLPGVAIELGVGTTNGVKVESLDHIMVSNGTRIIPITQVLQPPEQ